MPTTISMFYQPWMPEVFSVVAIRRQLDGSRCEIGNAGIEGSK
jgi:hypothetical protein